MAALRHRECVAVAAAAVAGPATAAAAKSSPASSATAAAAADARLALPPGVKGAERAGGEGARGRAGMGRGLSGRPRRGKPGGRAGGGRRGGGGAAGQGDSPPHPPLPARPPWPRPAPAPAGAPPANQRPAHLHNAARAPPTPRPGSRGQNGLYAATTWREGKGAKMEGEGRWGVRGGGSWVLSREGGRMGRGVSIQTQTITKPSKAARGRLCGSPFLGVFGSRAKSWSITSCAEKTAVGVSGPEARRPARRGVSDCVGGAGGGCRRGWSLCLTQTRDLQVGLGGLTTRCGIGLDSLGFGCWGRRICKI